MSYTKTQLISTSWCRYGWRDLTEQPEEWGSDLAHGLSVDEVIVAPDAGVIVVLPLHVDIEVGEVVALRD